MLDIKFDAIYKPTGEHFVPHQINFNTMSITGDFGGERNNWCYSSLDGKRGDVILRQFTGLHDKNEARIHVGDVVEITNPQGNHKERGKIMFDSKHGKFAWEEPMSGILYGIVDGDSANEVIGNIYENPELLSQ